MGTLFKKLIFNKSAASFKKGHELDDGMSSTSSAFTCASITESEYETPHGCLTIRTQEESLRVPATSTFRPQHSKASVHFSTVQVRVYPTILSDQPQCTAGPPIGIGWDHDASLATIWEIDDHQRHVNPLNINRQTKFAKKALALSSWRRERILLSHGYSQAALDAASDAAETIRQQRQRSLEQGHSSPSPTPRSVVAFLFKSSGKARDWAESAKISREASPHKNQQQARKLTDQLY